MKYMETRTGRTFVLRLDQGEVLHEQIEAFAKEQGVLRGVVFTLGGAESNSELITGPGNGENFAAGKPINTHFLDGVHESAGVGTIFPDEGGEPVLHLHMTCGRKDRAITGCARNGVVVWLYMEVVIIELQGERGTRLPDAASGFSLLCVD